MTFSIAARDGATFGIAVSSSSPAVAARCAHVRAGVGAVCSQNVTDPRLGQAILDRMAAGQRATAAVAETVRDVEHAEWRQLTAVGIDGEPAVFSGAKTLGTHAGFPGERCVAAGNMLADPAIPEAMVRSCASSDGPLAVRLLAALDAAKQAGGEQGPVHSAGLVIVRDVPWPVTDLRIDWTEDDPIAALRALWTVWAPHEEEYRRRALDPDAAAGYGVPGDER